jgi:hypothetical protein
MSLAADHVMTALQLDKVLEAGGVTIEDLRQENACKVRAHQMFSRILIFFFVTVFQKTFVFSREITFILAFHNLF